MTELIKCEGGNCILKHYCVRYIAKTDYDVAYFDEVPYDDIDHNCEEFEHVGYHI